MSTYNGWTNYETWNVALWIDNERGTYEESVKCDNLRSVMDAARALLREIEGETR